MKKKIAVTLLLSAALTMGLPFVSGAQEYKYKYIVTSKAYLLPDSTSVRNISSGKGKIIIEIAGPNASDYRYTITPRRNKVTPTRGHGAGNTHMEISAARGRYYVMLEFADGGFIYLPVKVK